MMTLTSKTKRIIIICGAAVLAIVLFVSFALYHNRPQRTVELFMNAVKAQDAEAAMAFTATDLTDSQKEDIGYYIEDWTSSDNMVYVVDKQHAAWRTRDTMTTVDGKKVPAVDKKGKTIKEILPTPHYWSHFYEQYVTVSFDDYEDPIIIRLRRDTGNTWSPFAQLFSGWKVVKIDYQPLSAADLEDAGIDDSE